LAVSTAAAVSTAVGAFTAAGAFTAEATDKFARGDSTMKREMNMIQLRGHQHSGRARSALVSFAMLAMWAPNGAYAAPAQQSAQPTFASAPEASQALFEAVQGNNEQVIATILGGPTELTSSPDKGQDKLDRELFVQKYKEMHRLGREADGSVTLYIGAENWPFPIPVVEKSGAWRFDSDAGSKEVMFRRIGENELTAMDICHEFVAAKKHDRAPLNTAHETDSAASLLAKVSRVPNSGDPVLFNGYYFKVLSTGPTSNSKGGFVLMAYPAEYRSSGVMTFVVNGNDVVYEKDLGANTSALASAMSAFHRDASWRVAGE
jgi:hypothetical protein